MCYTSKLWREDKKLPSLENENGITWFIMKINREHVSKGYIFALV